MLPFFLLASASTVEEEENIQRYEKVTKHSSIVHTGVILFQRKDVFLNEVLKNGTYE